MTHVYILMFLIMSGQKDVKGSVCEEKLKEADKKKKKRKVLLIF